MNVEVLKPTAVNFRKYGKIVRIPANGPTSHDENYRFWSDIAAYHIDGETEIGLCTVFRQPQQRITAVERHLRTPEILIPIDAPFVLPLMKEATAGVETFEFNVGEAVVIDPAIWHGACLPVGKNASSYFVIFRRGTPREDVEKLTISPTNIL